jgi:hypothetical protein
MYEPDELEALVEAEGWHAEFDATRWFIFGSAPTPLRTAPQECPQSPDQHRGTSASGRSARVDATLLP